MFKLSEAMKSSGMTLCSVRSETMFDEGGERERVEHVKVIKEQASKRTQCHL